ncbi:adenylate/guanylate cyclase domain-containing protein [Pelagibius litoralis]|uniref:Adenylate/guanylate cyclase domain-containing protein n=1 Tax=Pelagibius litoralis TaxID=374515 RepID=A0A967F3B8_9PROT|nr:adenylate/guanylate cyclase domain-containing protein [Pelagibius litoralis]NIA72461.1 adenylate/guanylate cyclase domain-containing protein [Pelagibius litoralis]
MAAAQSQTFHWQFKSPPQAIWPLLADTVRFNEAAGLPRYDVSETLQDDGTVLFEGAMKRGPLTVTWREIPTNWVTGRWFEHRREFRNGPLRDMTARLVLTAEDGGRACHADYTLTATPANLLGRLILKAGFFSSTAKTFATLAVDADRFAGDASPQPFSFRAPTPSPQTRRHVSELVARIEAGPHGHGLARRLADHLLTAQEADLIHLRPLALARDWQVEERAVIELCLEAVRAGLLIMRWDLLCPRCRVPKAAVEALDGLPQGAHCDTCNIDYGRDFSRNVELSFAPAPAVRPLGAGEHCLFGPMSTPHVWVQRTLAAGQSLTEACDLPPGRYVLRTLEAGPEFEMALEDGAALPEVVLGEDSVSADVAGRPGQVILRNGAARPLTAIVEERRWVRDALTADRVTAIQAFRDLFSDQVLRPGDEVSVARIALLFTDLRRSTDLYGRIGDAAAYHLVRDHFAFIGAIVRRHNGAVVKTIGDAVMAAFAAPADAVAAGLAVQREVAAFNAGEQEPVAIKLGVHEGPCIAVTLNGRLDYFGTTVNMAARLQGKSEGGDLVLSAVVSEDHGVTPLLDGLDCINETTNLKGFDVPVAFRRIRL